jgi:hypothetical protein
VTSTITGRVKPRIEIAPGADPAGDPSLWTWLDAGKRRAKVDIVIGAGRDDEASEVEAGTFSATMDNRDGRLSPRNILGPYYGDLGRGTPLRLILDRASDDFTRSVAGSWGTSPDGFTWSLSGGTAGVNGTQATLALPTNNAARAVLTDAGSADVEVTWSTTLDVMPTGGAFVSAALLRHTDASNYVRAHVELQAAGTVAVKVQRLVAGAQSDLLALTATSVTYSAGTKVWGKARADGPYVMVKTWTGLITDEPATWQGATVDDSVEGVGTGLFMWRINTNAGTYTAKFDDFELTNILWTGNVPEWSPKWPEKSGTDSTLPLAGAGILRRLSQGASPLNSPLLNQLTAQNPFTYFPLEEASGAQQASEAKSGKAATLIDVTFAGDDTLPGATTSATLNTANVSRFRTTIASSPTPDGYAALWFFRLDTIPAVSTPFLEMSSKGTMTRFTLALEPAGLSWNGYSDDGTLIANATSLYVVDPTKWIAMQLETNVSGGTTSVALIWHEVGSSTFYASTDTYTGTSSKPDVCSIWAVTNSMSLGHVWFGDNDLPFVDSTFMLVSDGFRTEQAADRIARLCAESNVPVYILSGETEPMGRQRPGKLVDLLRECEGADQGILCERGNALMYVPRVRRYNASVDMALDWSLGHLDEAPEPTDDDQRYRNKWTVSRIDGGTVTVTDEASIAKAGTLDDSADLNIADDSRLADFAGWFLNDSTADYLRWPRIKINLVAHPELIPQWLACRIGSRITLANPPSTQLAGEVVDLVIEGYTETINNYVWTVELACVPAQAWLIGAYDDGVTRYDAYASVLGDVAESDVWCPLVVADALGAYSQTSVPYNVKIAGQINTVVSMTKLGTVAAVDGSFEAYDNTKWLAFNAAATPPVRTSAGGGHRGQYGITATANGVDSQYGIRPIVAVQPSASPGQTFTLTLWAKRSTAGNLTATIDWYNGVTYLSSSTTTVAVGADTWTEISVSATAPASTTTFTYGPTIGGTPAAGVLLTVDDIDIVRTDVVSLRQTAILTRAVDGFTKALPDGSPFRIANGGRYGL